MSRIPDSELREVIERADGFCEACGLWLGLDGVIHHRHARGMGGAGNHFPWIDTAPNLMIVNGSLRLNCHNLTEYSIHQNPDRSKRLGHIVPWGVDPATVEVTSTASIFSVRA